MTQTPDDVDAITPESEIKTVSKTVVASQTDASESEPHSDSTTPYTDSVMATATPLKPNRYASKPEKPLAALGEDVKETDAMAMLVELAKKGQIDPWNIDIVKVADEFLKAVADMKHSDLKITGKTLLYLAVLLRMKSDQLAGINYLDPPEDEFDEFGDGFEPDFMDGVIQPRLRFNSLEEAIQQRTSRKEKRIRTVTLNDLIDELKRYEELEKNRSTKERVKNVSNRRVRDYSEFTADDIEEMAHEEFIEDTIHNLMVILERVLIKQEKVALSELQESGGIDKISAFLALLFLSARGEVDLSQESFYSEVYISKDTTPIPPPSEDEPVDTGIETELNEAS